MTAHQFLAINKPMGTDVLVVEGWISDYAFEAAVELFVKGHYKKMLTIVGPEKPSDLKKDASLIGVERAFRILKNFGIEEENVIAIPATYANKHRTLSSALALKDWLNKSEYDIRSLDVITETVHARKSYIIFKKVFSPDIQVGIIAAPTLKYNSKHWFFSLTGIRLVSRNFIGFLYAITVDKCLALWPHAGRSEREIAQSPGLTDRSNPRFYSDSFLLLQKRYCNIIYKLR